MAKKSNYKRRLPLIKKSGNYYARVRWGTDNVFRGDLLVPLNTTRKNIAEHRRDTIQDTSLRGKIIQAYEENGTIGVRRIRDEIDWISKGGTLVNSAKATIHAIAEYEIYLVSKRLKPTTIEIYMRTLNEFYCICNVNYVDRIKPMHFTRYRNSMPNLSAHTINRKLRSLRTWFTWMLNEGYIKKDIHIEKLPAIKPPVNFFSNAEFEVILQNVKKGFPYGEAKMQDDDRELFISAYWLYRDTGLRLSEPFDSELKRDDEGYRLKIIGSITKNNYLRFVYLTEQQAMTVIQMNDWLEGQLKTRKSRVSTIKVFSKVFKKALMKSHIKGKLHDLRKTFASRLYFLTGSEFALCHALGHTDTSMTKQYTNLDKVELARSFPDIVAMKDGVLEDKKGLRGTKKGGIELYSNFGFMHVT